MFTRVREVSHQGFCAIW